MTSVSISVKALSHDLVRRKASTKMSTNSDSDAYVLGRNSSETHRLDAQHTLILRATKGLLYHPSLGDLSQFSCILDSAAGTAVWAAHVAAGGGGEEGWQVTKLREGCVVEASDISGKQVPDPLPRGVSAFYEQDVTKPFPPDKLGRCASSACLLPALADESIQVRSDTPTTRRTWSRRLAGSTTKPQRRPPSVPSPFMPPLFAA